MKALIAATLLTLAGAAASAALECNNSTRLERLTLSITETGPGAIAGVFTKGDLEIEFQGLQTESLSGRRYEILNETLTAVEVHEKAPQKPPCPRCAAPVFVGSTKAIAFVDGSQMTFNCFGSL